MANFQLSSDQARIDDEASEWVVRLSERPLDQQETRELESWRAADPRHDQTFTAMQRTWDELPEFTHLAVLTPIDEQSPPLSPGRPQARPLRYAIGGFTALAATFLAIAFFPLLFSSGGPDYATPIGQARLVVLPDGSHATLGPKSSLDVEFSASERRVRLAGEAFFEVAHNENRPFLVEAGKALVRDVGTKFDVNTTEASLRVAVLEGAVEVAPDKFKATKSNSGPRLLHAGQRVEVTFGSATLVGNADSVTAISAASAASPPGAWRDGRLSYDNARLGDVVADLNRYYAPGVRLDEPELGDLRVTASFKPSEIPAFLGSLDKVLPLQADQRTGGTVQLRAQNS